MREVGRAGTGRCRAASISGPAGTIVLGYTSGQTVNGMLASVSVDGTTMATAAYSHWVDLGFVSYANGTTLTVTPDHWAGAPADMYFKLAGGATLTRSQVTRNASGRIVVVGDRQCCVDVHL